MSKKQPRDRKQIEHGFLVVHGIGGTHDGSTVDAFLTPVTELIRARHGDGAVSIEASDLVPGHTAKTVRVDLDGRKGRPVLVTEARWTELSSSGKRLSWAAVAWSLRSFLVMIPVLIGPSAAEIRRLQHLFRPESSGGLTRSEQIALVPIALRGLWRLATVAVVLAAVVWCGRQLWAVSPWLLVGTAALLVIALVVALVALPTDLAGQVRVVAEDGPVRQRILDEVTEVLGSVDRVCRSVTVVAHSQGGYLVHQVLSRSAPSTVREFVALGSGLKPISLLRYFRMPGRWWPAIVSLVGVAVMTVSGWMLMDPDKLLGGGQLADLMEPGLVLWAAPWLTLDLGPTLFTNAASAAELGAYLPALGRSWPWILLSFVGAGIVFGGQIVAARFGDGVTIAPLPKSVRRWREYATPHDVVGRLAFPELPSTVELVDVHGVNTFSDHRFAEYFARGARLTAQMAEELLLRAGHQRAADVLRQDATPGLETLQRTASRWYRLRGLLQLCLIGLVLVVPTALGRGSVFVAFQTGWPWSLGIAVVTGFMALSAMRRARDASARGMQRTGPAAHGNDGNDVPGFSIPVAVVLACGIVNDLATMLGLALLDGRSGFALQPMGAFVQHAFACMLAGVLVVSGFRLPVWGAVVFLVPTLIWFARVVTAPFPAVYLLPPGMLAALLMVVLQVTIAVLALVHAVRVRRRSRSAAPEYRTAA
jgi:hypothetical protein